MKFTDKIANFLSTISLRKKKIYIDKNNAYPANDDVYSKFEYIKDIYPEDAFIIKPISEEENVE